MKQLIALAVIAAATFAAAQPELQPGATFEAPDDVADKLVADGLAKPADAPPAKAAKAVRVRLLVANEHGQPNDVRELPAEVAAVLTPAEQDEWKEWRVKQDEEHLKSVAQYELDTLAERLGVIRTGIQKGYAATDNKNAVAIRNGTRAVLRLLADLMPEPVKGRPVIEEEYEPLMLPNFATPGTPEFDSYQRLLEEHERRKAQDQGG